jgi:serine protease
MPARLPRRAVSAALLAGALAGVSTSHAQAARVVPHEVVVAYRGPRASAASATGHAGTQARPRILHVRDVRAELRRLRGRPDVAYAVPNVVAHAADFIPNDPGADTISGDWQKLQWNFVGPFGVNAPAAWQHLIDVGRPGGRGVIVAVLDTGVAYSNRPPYKRSPDFSPSQFVRGYDFVGHDPYANDVNGHGTHVASTIAEKTNNAVGLTGLAYGVKIMPVRVLDNSGEGDATNIADGIRFAASHGAKVINMSLEFDSDVTAHDIPQLLSAVAYAHRKGSIIVAASGNEGSRLVAYPARATNVVSVGATTEHGCLSEFSNGGPGLDLVAPGGGNDAYLPDEPNCRSDQPPGHNIFQVTLTGAADRRRFGIPDNYEGTSMAVPHVSATAALVIASGVLGPDPSPAAVEQRLKQTARDLGTPGYDTRYGWGLVDAGAATALAPPTTPPPTSSG